MSNVCILEKDLGVKFDVIDLTKDLIQRSSLTPYDAGCQDLLTERLAPLRFNVERFEFEGVQNLWARRGTAAPLLVFVGHTDVVPTGPEAEWQSLPFSPTVRDNHLYGRGAADMKGGIAAFIVALEHFIAEHPSHQGSVGLLLTSDEEGSGVNGVVRVVNEYLKKNQKVDYCLVGEPISDEWAGDTIKNGGRGVLNGKLVVQGVEGHVAYPQLAVNPIHRLVAPLAELCSTEWDHGNAWFPATSFQVTNIHAGNGTDNSIPGTVEASLNFRFSPESTVERLEAAVETILLRHKLDFHIEWKTHGLPFLTKDGELLEAAKNAVFHTIGRAPRVSTMGGTSDGRHIATSFGAQVVELGLVSKTIHKTDECVRIDDLEMLTVIYQRILENLLL